MEKYRYIRKTVTWNHHRELRGKDRQEACDKLADLITTLKLAGGPGPWPGSNLTVDQWFAQWQGTPTRRHRAHPQKFRPL